MLICWAFNDSDKADALFIVAGSWMWTLALVGFTSVSGCPWMRMVWASALGFDITAVLSIFMIPWRPWDKEVEMHILVFQVILNYNIQDPAEDLTALVQ